jgi:hypothetical protein
MPIDYEAMIASLRACGDPQKHLAAQVIEDLCVDISETVNERDEARGAAVKANRAVERLHGLLREMKAAMLGYPMSMRALTPTALLHAINAELREPEEATK